MKAQYEIELFDPQNNTRAFIVIDRLIGGLAAGGIRMSPNVTMDEIRSLAEIMTYKHSMMDIPLGGAKIGIVGDPNSNHKLEKITAFAKMAEPILRSMLLVGEDMGMTSSDVKHVYNSIQFDPSSLVIDQLSEKGIDIKLPEGKSIDDLLSEEFMDYLAGFGLVEAIDESTDFLHLNLQTVKVAVQGFGTVGNGIIRLLAAKGVKICAISDIIGTVYSENGFRFEELENARTDNGLIRRDHLRQYTFLEPNDILTLPVDILIPAAVSNVITEKNANQITAKLIVEGSNMPTTKEADYILKNNQITVLPDFIVNSGSATGFGLLITAQANVENVLDECSKRIRQKVKHLLVESVRKDKTTREIAMEMATTNLQQIIDAEREKNTTKASR
ncbi:MULTISPECIES: Glu/Leu/Phe/Val family dehydrogenase [Metabacillus]|uniref:Glutamate dehydrogenase n=2 Tax=Metabacillus TaxID=2675233 RepID=A0A179T2F1_9BACI|nr:MULTISPECIES: Glu/Leu/Phe/Val dehydrogenase dimerization domain-containing protein [Metabacillus]OAS88286.1 hypothetical protein A6K24_16395 [Metabacillus litoralis]QNF28011.1 Glu/Leu/Phe/Val dehydrogenase [Metabacillus sp. KUDC1714]